MKVPLLDLTAQYATIRTEVLAAIERVCASQQFILGPEVAAFEQEVKAFCGARFAIGMSSGTDALLAALLAVGVGPGDEVITSAYSFFASAGVIARCGARPVFVDIDPDTFNVRPERVTAAITDATRAIMPVHLFGRCAELGPVLESARARGIAVVEDAAQAIGARDAAGCQAGRAGQIGCFSFFPSKNLGAFGDGGLVVTDDEALAGRLGALRVHGARKKYHHDIVGGNFRLDAIQAAVLRVKLPHLGGWTMARRAHAARYRELFEARGLTDLVALPADVPGHIYNQFVIRVPRREALREVLAAREVQTEVYYPLALSQQPCFAALGHKSGDFPHAETAAEESLALPVYPELRDEQQRHVVDTIADFYRR